jgi:F0F1-type ATP synthase membrane subunit b/b'
MDNTIAWTLIVGAAAVWAFWKFVWPKADANGDGKIDASDIKAAADVNKDGKVDAKDAVEVVKKTTARAKKVATKTVAKTKAKK